MNLSFNFIKSVSNIYDEMIENGFSLVYLGEFSHGITKMFTSMAESDMEKQSEERSVQRKVFHVMVETLQNMNKHSDEIRERKNRQWIVYHWEEVGYLLRDYLQHGSQKAQGCP